MVRADILVIFFGSFFNSELRFRFFRFLATAASGGETGPSMVENFFWDGSNLTLAWKKPFDLVAERPIFHNGRANREHWKTLFSRIYGYFIKNPNLMMVLKY